jgi:hypothetical protein
MAPTTAGWFFNRAISTEKLTWKILGILVLPRSRNGNDNNFMGLSLS